MSTTSSQPKTKTTLLQDALRQYWGYDEFLPLQEEAMSCVMAGHDSVVVLPTGGGKSLCFQAPAMCLNGLALVVSPLISLMKDQVDALQSCGVPAAFLNSTLSAPKKREIADQIRRRELKLVYVAPERLLTEQTLSFLSTAGVSLIAIDEAHCISAWGHDFRPEYRGLRILKQHFPGVGIHAYTATASEQVRQDIAQQLGLNAPRMLVGGFDRPNLSYRVRRASGKFQQVCEVLERHRGESGIVYCISRKEVDKMAAGLEGIGFRAAPYHAGMADIDRRKNQDAFISDQVDVIVATVAFGMGIDKPNVRFVVHAGMPKSLEHYQQESGRAGRDGLEAECTLLFGAGDIVTWRKMLADSEQPARDGALRALDAMQDFCTSVVCRHRAIVQYFGQDLDGDNCGACDVCLGELDLVDDPITIGQKILSCVLRLDQRFGADYTAKVLAGSQEQRILQAGHNQLSTYGLLQDDGLGAIRDWIEQLVGQGFLEKSGEFNVLHVTESGQRLLKREVEPQLLRPAEKQKESRMALVDSWDGVDRQLFDALRHLRSDKATQQKVPAYVIFGDAALRDMARLRPSTLDKFRGVKGVGEKKLADYGQEFLTAINSHCQQRQLAQDVEPTIPARAAAPITNGVNASSIASFPFFRQGATIEEVAKQMNRARSTVVGYLNDYLKHEKAVDPSPWVAAEDIRRIEQAIEQVGAERLKPIHEHLNGEVAYDEIRIVATCRVNRER
ncbi:MAG TPA: DNA helicase RecQ [Pirellulaceae bacterium]|nr:DNA helicase RecQ [Pirellulaceae bacterium]